MEFLSSYVGSPTGDHRAVATELVATPIAPGGSASVSATFAPEPDEIDVDVPWFVRVDDVGDGTGENNECLEVNNVTEALFHCEAIG